MQQAKGLKPRGFERFVAPDSKNEPFPPSYYACKKQAENLSQQMHNPKLLKSES